ncbi:MAG: camphor resistance protein CrcB [Phenylobacterium sp.]|nr:camphor resistance protein CrcB [Phenylobacterium sp.]
MAVDGLITLRSGHGPAETMARLAAEVEARGLKVFARIDHAAGAADAGLPLRPTTLLVFGSAKGGTPLMQAAQTIGIDLPLKALVWQDAAGDTWLSYNDPRWLAKRHGLGGEIDATLSGLAGLLAAVAAAAASS